MIFEINISLTNKSNLMKAKYYGLVLIILTGMFFSSCNKNVDPPKPSGDGFESLQVPKGFTWSTLNKTHFKVQIVDASGNPSNELNNFPLDATDLFGNLLQRVTIKEGIASYYLELNKSITDVRFYSPTHEISHLISLNDDTKEFELPATLKMIKEYTDSDGDGVFNDFDDFPNDPSMAYRVYYPSPYENSALKSTDYTAVKWYYQMFEDLWPSKGDYDLNDLIIKLRMVVNFNSQNQWTSGSFSFYVWTNGAALNLGCGMEFFDYLSNDGNKLRLRYLYDDQIALVPGHNIIGSDPDVENSFIIFQNADDFKSIDYSNTGIGLSANPMVDSLKFDYTVSPPTTWMAAFMYLFYTDDRTHEVRPIGMPPTIASNWSLLGTGSDDSPTIPWNYTPGTEFLYPTDPPFFATSLGHPWGIELEYAGDLKVAFEKVSIIDAFPEFKDWAESGGTLNTYWYENPVNDPTKVFDVSALITQKK